jgi:hypothetical protein
VKIQNFGGKITDSGSKDQKATVGSNNKDGWQRMRKPLKPGRNPLCFQRSETCLQSCAGDDAFLLLFSHSRYGTCLLEPDR